MIADFSLHLSLLLLTPCVTCICHSLYIVERSLEFRSQTSDKYGQMKGRGGKSKSHRREKN